jgi:hypothetical protein
VALAAAILATIAKPEILTDMTALLTMIVTIKEMTPDAMIDEATIDEMIDTMVEVNMDAISEMTIDEMIDEATIDEMIDVIPIAAMTEMTPGEVALAIVETHIQHDVMTTSLATAIGVVEGMTEADVIVVQTDDAQATIHIGTSL